MAKIEVHLKDGQRLGWVQMRDGKTVLWLLQTGCH